MPSRDATTKEVAVIFICVLLFVGGLIIGTFYDTYIGGAIILSLVVFAFVAYFRMARPEKQQMFQAMEEYEKTPLGKFMAMGNWLLTSIIAITILWAAVQWLLQR